MRENDGNVFVASERFPGTCSRCGQAPEKHQEAERYCFDAPPPLCGGDCVLIAGHPGGCLAVEAPPKLRNEGRINHGQVVTTSELRISELVQERDSLRAQLREAEREARNAGARAAELWAFVQYVRSREHTIAEMDAYAERLYDEGPYEIGARIVGERDTARARADALEVGAGAMRAPLGNLCAAMEGLRPFPLPLDPIAADLIAKGRSALSGTAGKRAAEVIAAAREHDAALKAQEEFSCPHYEPPCECHKVGAAIDERVERSAARLRAALAAYDGGGESK